MNTIRHYLNKYKEVPVQAKAAFWFLICSFMQKGITVITTPIFTRLLTTEEYGRFNVFNSWYGILFVFIALSLCYGLFSQGLIKFEEDRNRFIVSVQSLLIVLVLSWTVIYLLFASFWNNLFKLNTVQMLALLLMCWTSSVFSFWAAEQRTLYKYRSLVILSILSAIAKPALGIILVITADDKVTARILGLVAVELVAGIYCFLAQIRKGKGFFDLKYWKYSVLFCLPLVPHYLSQTVLNNSDRIMIERLVSADAAGIYSLAYSISMLMTLFNSALGQTISPWMFKKIKDKQFQDLAPVTYGTLVFMAIVNILLIFLTPEIVRIFAPPQYYEAIWTVPPVAVSCFFLFMYDYYARFEFYYEKTLGIMFASVFGAILNIILNYIFIRIYGYIAAAYTTLVCYIVYSASHYLLMRRACRTNGVEPDFYSTKIIVGLSLVFMAAGFAIMLTYSIPWLRFTLLGLFLLALALNYKKWIRAFTRFMSLRKKENG